MKFLVDTCVISEVVKPSAHRGVVRWLEDQDESGLYLSVLTLGELEKGVAKLPDSRKKTRLAAWLRGDLADRFRNRLLPVDRDVAPQWAHITAACKRAGRSMPAIDSLIAATALAHRLVVVTRNTQDIEASGVEVFNPWL